MDMKSGEIREFQNKEFLDKACGLKPITQEEHLKFKNIPESERPCELELSRYMDPRNSRYKGIEMFIVKQAFRAGYKVATENARS